jgi:predicted nucleic acid-binding protein
MDVARKEIELDTSVIIAYYLPETYSAQVQKIYLQYQQPGITTLIEAESAHETQLSACLLIP